MVVELISVGTEILIGNIINTNAQFLSRKCAELGLNVYHQVTVGDNEERLGEVIKTALTRSDIIILTGGLGPTKDDLTKEVTAKILGLELILDPDTKQRIEEYFKHVKREQIAENNWKQADIIYGAKVINNDNGTAPGLHINTNDNKHIFLLPGPPSELIPMVNQNLANILKDLSKDRLYSVMVKICGIGESMAETMISDLIETQSNPTIAPYAKLGQVHFRLTARAKNVTESKRIMNPIIDELKNRFRENIYTCDEEVSLEEHVISLLKDKNLTVTAAESCTGGMFLSQLINVSGASDVINEGYITYSNEAKMRLLGVLEETLSKHGAVSLEVAREMALGAAKFANSKTAIGITGIAGPGGGSEEKPVGTVCVGCVVLDRVVTKRFQFKGNREKIRELSVVNALDLLRRCIMEYSV